MESILKYIDSLELNTPDFSFQFDNRLISTSDIPSNTAKENAYLNFKTLQSFVANVSKQHQEDALNSMLLAQRAASKAFPDNHQLLEWYNCYFGVLSKLGWFFEDSGFLNYNIRKSNFDIYNAILEILTGALSGNLQKIALKALNALRNLSDKDSRITAFEKYTTIASKGSFQIGTANDEGGVLSLSLCAFILTSKHNIKRILFFKSDKKSVDFEYKASTASLNESIFTNDVRKAIKDKLGDISDYITDLNI